MTNGKYKVGIYITGNPANDYNALFSQTKLASVTEVVLWAKFDKTQTTYSHNFQQYVTSATSQISITLEMIKNYLGKDGNPYDYSGVAKLTPGTPFLSKIAVDCDPRLAQVIWTPGQVMWDNAGGWVLFTKPYLDKSGEVKNHTGFQLRKGADPTDPTAGGAQGFSTACETGSVIFRYAEALLNLAEAQSELGIAVNYATT